MTIGIGGAGSKMALAVDPQATIVNVSETELNKQPADHRILAVVHAAHGQLRGSRKNPQIGKDAFLSIKREMLNLIRGNMLFTSTGGGTGNGITASLLEELSLAEDVPDGDKTLFAMILPYAKREPAEFVNNTIDFLQGPLSEAVDSGNTGNLFLLSNQLKFESRISERDYNAAIADSLHAFLSIPQKGEACYLLEGHIDYEDFSHYTGRPYFNHFTYFDFDPAESFESQFHANLNPYLLPPDDPIEAVFLLETPPKQKVTPFYDILDYFASQNVTPMYSVVENSDREHYFVTVSVLYSRKPDELVEDFNRISHQHTQAKLRKSLQQHVALPKLEVNLESEAKQAARQSGAAEDDILEVLKRLGKI